VGQEGEEGVGDFRVVDFWYHEGFVCNGVFFFGGVFLGDD